jgi:signal transduction histidine kinase
MTMCDGPVSQGPLDGRLSWAILLRRQVLLIHRGTGGTSRLGGRKSAVGPSDHALACTVLAFAIALRCGGVAAAVAAAAIGDGDGISRGWQVGVLTGLTIWALIFAARAIRSGLSVWLVSGDALIMALALLGQGHYVSVAAVADETTWVITLASSSIYVAQLVLRPPLGLVLAVLVIAAYQVGLPTATSEPRIMVVQTVAVSAIMELLRRGGRKADALVTERNLERRRLVVADACRADEREHRARLHDSVLATLAMVASGAVRSGDSSLRSAAMRSLTTFADQASEWPPLQRAMVGDGPMADLADLLAAQVDDWSPRLLVELAVTPLTVPRRVALTIVEATGEALRNVERHAGTSRVRIRAAQSAGVVTVEINDDGRGFSPAVIPEDRYGIKESIVERMTAVGGSADVASAPGRGTRVTLRWSDG